MYFRSRNYMHKSTRHILKLKQTTKSYENIVSADFVGLIKPNDNLKNPPVILMPSEEYAVYPTRRNASFQQCQSIQGLLKRTELSIRWPLIEMPVTPNTATKAFIATSLQPLLTARVLAVESIFFTIVGFITSWTVWTVYSNW